MFYYYFQLTLHHCIVHYFHFLIMISGFLFRLPDHCKTYFKLIFKAISTRNMVLGFWTAEIILFNLWLVTLIASLMFLFYLTLQIFESFTVGSVWSASKCTEIFFATVCCLHLQTGCKQPAVLITFPQSTVFVYSTITICFDWKWGPKLLLVECCMKRSSKTVPNAMRRLKSSPLLSSIF